MKRYALFCYDGYYLRYGFVESFDSVEEAKQSAVRQFYRVVDLSEGVEVTGGKTMDIQKKED